MLVVLARDGDAVARQLAAICEPGEVVTLQPADLASPGWCDAVGALPLAAPAAAIGGRVIPRACISGVLTRLPSIAERDVRHVAREDRPYVAAEMTAFLIGWLSGLECPIVNRPTPQCMAGPFWSPERWAIAAADAGLRVRPVSRRVVLSSPLPDPPARDLSELTVVGQRCFGDADSDVQAAALRLARAARVELLSLHLDVSDNALVSANPWPEFLSMAVLQAIRDGLYG